MLQQIVGADQSAQAVADQEDALAGLPALNPVEVALEGLSVIAEALDVLALALRLAVAVVVESVNAVAAGHEMIDHVAVAPAVFAQAMHQQQHSFGVAVREPVLVVDAAAARAAECAVLVLHGNHFYQRTTAASMVNPGPKAISKP